MAHIAGDLVLVIELFHAAVANDFLGTINQG